MQALPGRPWSTTRRTSVASRLGPHASAITNFALRFILSWAALCAWCTAATRFPSCRPLTSKALSACSSLDAPKKCTTHVNYQLQPCSKMFLVKHMLEVMQVRIPVPACRAAVSCTVVHSVMKLTARICSRHILCVNKVHVHLLNGKCVESQAIVCGPKGMGLLHHGCKRIPLFRSVSHVVLVGDSDNTRVLIEMFDWYTIVHKEKCENHFGICQEAFETCL
jgi:hypothetical protein